MASISTQHSYIVLSHQEDSFRRGALVELGSDGRYKLHRHSKRYFPEYTRMADSDLAPLDEEQCVILDGIGSDDVRYTVYSTPGLLEWGVGLKVGDTVLAQLPDRSGRGSSGGDQYTTAIIRWIGRALFSGHQFGVEITVSSLLYHHIMTSHHTITISVSELHSWMESTKPASAIVTILFVFCLTALASYPDSLGTRLPLHQLKSSFCVYL